MSVFPDGIGIFETLLTIDSRPVLLTRHLDRAAASSLRLGLAIPDREVITKAVFEYLQANPIESSRGRLRLVFPGNAQVQMVHQPYEPPLKPARLMVAATPFDETSPLVGCKALPYRSNMELLELARSSGFSDALRFNTKGEMVETAVANVLVRCRGTWITPALSSGALPGIMRALALDWFPISEQIIVQEELPDVDSIFLISSLRGFQPVESLQGRALVIDWQMAQKADSFTDGLSVG